MMIENMAVDLFDGVSQSIPSSNGRVADGDGWTDPHIQPCEFLLAFHLEPASDSFQRPLVGH